MKYLLIVLLSLLLSCGQDTDSETKSIDHDYSFELEDGEYKLTAAKVTSETFQAYYTVLGDYKYIIKKEGDEFRITKKGIVHLSYDNMEGIIGCVDGYDEELVKINSTGEVVASTLLRSGCKTTSNVKENYSNSVIFDKTVLTVMSFGFIREVYFHTSLTKEKGVYSYTYMKMY